MASTNKTTNYNLSQFIGTDKPAWLSDYNQDMSKIDTGIHNAATTATGADGKADSANTAIGTLTNLTTSVKTDLVSAINEVDTNADTAQNTANAANSTATSAASSLQSLETYLTLDTFNTYTNDSGITAATGSMLTSSITVARNSTGSMAKIYGVLRHKNTGTGTQTININVDTGLRPDSDVTISPTGFLIGSTSAFNGNNVPVEVTVKVKTNGYLVINYDASFVPSNFYYGFLFPCLYFIQDWGDAPTPE